MTIRHNILSLKSLNKLNKNNKATSDVIEKLFSGFRINKAADDAVSLVQIAEDRLGSIHNLNLI